MIDLIKPDEIEALSGSSGHKFMEIERIARIRLQDALTIDSNPKDDYDLRAQYMVIVATAAEELGISNVTMQTNFQDEGLDFPAFERLVQAAYVRIQLKSAAANDPYSVQLTTGNRERIKIQIDRLRQMVDSSSLEFSKRKALANKLDEFETELRNSRVGFGKAMKLLAFVGALTVGATTELADAPQAIATIIKFIGKDKASEDEARARLAPPPLAITHKKAVARPAPAAFPELDDDVPF